MESRLRLDILPQPTIDTCGPTCLHAVYRYHGEQVSLAEVVDGVPALHGGGTLAVQLGRHALARGYRATLWTLDLQVFDPTWFDRDGGRVVVDLAEKLKLQRRAKRGHKLRRALDEYRGYVEAGGRIRMEPFTAELLRRHLRKGRPILAGLSATWLYGEAREYGPTLEADDIRGEPTGHFVVLAGYDPDTRRVAVADPWHRNPADAHHYESEVQRVLAAIHLGILTFDANLLVVEPIEPDP